MQLSSATLAAVAGIVVACTGGENQRAARASESVAASPTYLALGMIGRVLVR